MILDTVRETISTHRMLPRGAGVLVAVSGGPDSVALLSALVALRPEFRLRLRAVYVDHGLRPAGARREARWVKELGRMWAVPVDLVRVKARRGGGESLEAVLRQARYRALVALARRRRCSRIAVGHTRDDQAETVLMWILRGTGTVGLAGIPPTRRCDGITLVRPLLESSRSDVQGYLRSLGVKPLLDETNRSGAYLRNRIRRKLLPLLEREYSPQIRRHLAGLAESVRVDLDWSDKELRRRFREVARAGRRGLRLDRNRLRRLPAGLRRGILRRAVEQIQGDHSGFGRRHWLALERLAVGEGRAAMDLPHRFRAEGRDGAELLLSADCRPRKNLVHLTQRNP